MTSLTDFDAHKRAVELEEENELLWGLLEAKNGWCPICWLRTAFWYCKGTITRRR